MKPEVNLSLFKEDLIFILLDIWGGGIGGGRELAIQTKASSFSVSPKYDVYLHFRERLSNPKQEEVLLDGPCLY